MAVSFRIYFDAYQYERNNRKYSSIFFQRIASHRKYVVSGRKKGFNLPEIDAGIFHCLNTKYKREHAHIYFITAILLQSPNMQNTILIKCK